MELNKKNKLILENMRLVKKLAKVKIKKISYNTSLQVRYEDLIAAGNLGLIEAVENYDECKGSFERFASKRILGSMVDCIREFFHWGKWMPRGVKVSSLDGVNLIYYDKNDSVEDCFNQIIQNLDETGKRVLRWHYVDCLTLKQIGDKLGLSKSRVSQLLNQYKCIIKTASTTSTLKV